MRHIYPAVIEKGDGPGYGVFFPDLPGCVSAGDTIEETLDMAKEAATLYVETLLEDGDDVPNPSNPDAIAVDDDINVAMLALVEVIIPGKKKRYNLTLDEELVRQIDQVAPNRSSFFEEAARVRLASSR